MSITIRAAVFERAGQPLRVEELELTPPRAREVLVRYGASGICHSDLHVWLGEWEERPALVLGHEGAGVVEAIGPEVMDVTVGDHVILSWCYPCRRCRACAAGRAWACTGTRSLEHVLDDGSTRLARPDGSPVRQYLAIGTFATHAVVPEAACVPVPHALPFEVGSLIGCCVATGVGAVVNTARVEPGASLVVVGCGGVGLSAVMGAALAGADPIVAVDLEPAKLDLAQDVGATHAVPAGGDVAAQVHAITGGGADYALEAIGLVPTIELLPSLVRRGGTVVLVGMTPLGQRAGFDPLDIADRGISILGSNYGSCVAAVDFPRLAHLHLVGKLPVERLVSHRIELAEVDDALAALHRRERARSVIVHTTT